MFKMTSLSSKGHWLVYHLLEQLLCVFGFIPATVHHEVFSGIQSCLKMADNWEETMLSKMPRGYEIIFYFLSLQNLFCLGKIKCISSWKWKLFVFCLYIFFNELKEKTNHQWESVKWEHLDEWVGEQVSLAWRD